MSPTDIAYTNLIIEINGGRLEADIFQSCCQMSHGLSMAHKPTLSPFVKLQQRKGIHPCKAGCYPAKYPVSAQTFPGGER